MEEKKVIQFSAPKKDVRRSVWVKGTPENNLKVCITQNYMNKCRCGELVIMQFIEYKDIFLGTRQNKKMNQRELFLGQCGGCHAIFFAGDYAK